MTPDQLCNISYAAIKKAEVEKDAQHERIVAILKEHIDDCYDEVTESFSLIAEKGVFSGITTQMQYILPKYVLETKDVGNKTTAYTTAIKLLIENLICRLKNNGFRNVSALNSGGGYCRNYCLTIKASWGEEPSKSTISK